MEIIQGMRILLEHFSPLNLPDLLRFPHVADAAHWTKALVPVESMCGFPSSPECYQKGRGKGRLKWSGRRFAARVQRTDGCLRLQRPLPFYRQHVRSH